MLSAAIQRDLTDTNRRLCNLGLQDSTSIELPASIASQFAGSPVSGLGVAGMDWTEFSRSAVDSKPNLVYDEYWSSEYEHGLHQEDVEPEPDK